MYNSAVTQLEKELETELLAIYDKCATIGYRPTYFKRMLISSNPHFNKGPVGTVRHLMAGNASADSGFRRLIEADKLGWTVEWLIAMNPKWWPLFPEWVVKEAKARVNDETKGNSK
jgi:hypothetical protein